MDHRRDRGDIPKSKKIYISHLEFDVISDDIQTSEDDLKKNFGKFGEI